MQKKYLSELMLFLNEIKVSKEVGKKYKWEIDRHIKFLKDILDKEEDFEKIKTDKKKIITIKRIIEIICNFFCTQ